MWFIFSETLWRNQRTWVGNVSGMTTTPFLWSKTTSKDCNRPKAMEATMTTTKAYPKHQQQHAQTVLRTVNTKHYDCRWRYHRRVMQLQHFGNCWPVTLLIKHNWNWIKTFQWNDRITLVVFIHHIIFSEPLFVLGFFSLIQWHAFLQTNFMMTFTMNIIIFYITCLNKRSIYNLFEVRVNSASICKQTGTNYISNYSQFSNNRTLQKANNFSL